MDTTKIKSRFKPTVIALLIWTLFIGIGAFAGGLSMLIDPSGKSLGMDKMLPYFVVLPFSDVLFSNFVFSGIMLLLVNCITNLTAATLILLRKKIGIILGGVFGITLMAWIVIQFIIFPFNFMSTIYFVFGLIQAATGYAAFVFYKQERFARLESKYSDYKGNGKNLVVFFSRHGYVKKIAYEKAKKINADIYEIKTTEKISGTAGFWWCGRFGMHRWDMPVEEKTIDLEGYEKIIICTPVWVFSLAAPVRAFLRKSAGKIKNAEYVVVHFSNGVYKNVEKEMDDILGLSNSSFESYSCKMGKYKKQKT